MLADGTCLCLLTTHLESRQTGYQVMGVLAAGPDGVAFHLHRVQLRQAFQFLQEGNALE